MTLRTSDESQQQQQGRWAESRLTRKRKKELKNANTIITSAGNGKQQQGRLKEKKLQHSLGVSVGLCVCVSVLTNNVGHNTHTHCSHTLVHTPRAASGPTTTNKN